MVEPSPKNLPTGISTFAKIRTGDYVYVDKTGLITRLLRGQYFFLSRPRRFGKSLLVDIIKEMFSGNRELFQGLDAYDSWDFEPHPVISINFAGRVISTPSQLRNLMQTLVEDNARRLDIQLPSTDDVGRNFELLIAETHAKYHKKVVILVDEYDKPILDNLTKPHAVEIKNQLRNLYSVLKAHDSKIRFAFFTGVSKFSKVSIFSGLNNLVDISLEPAYSTLCGYTQGEFERYFAGWLEGVDLSEVKQWYNGYSWDGESVYNPFDILLFLGSGRGYSPYWFETGTPTFLVDILNAGIYYLPKFEDLEAKVSDLGNFDIGRFSLETLLFQTGYLTIKNVERPFGTPIYQLGFPNTEVRTAFGQLALDNYLLNSSPSTLPMLKALKSQNIATIETSLRNLFASLANDNYRNNDIAHYEGYYANVIYAYLSSLGVLLTAEDVTSTGRIDLSVQFRQPGGQRVVYIFEFKVDKPSTPTDAALQQILTKKYVDKYRNPETTIHQIGMHFDPTTKTLAIFNHQAV